MSNGFPPSNSANFVNATTPIVRYPPEYFAFGAAGFRHVSTVLNDLALAASSIKVAPPIEVTPPPAKRRKASPTPYSATKDNRGYNIWRAVMVCLYRSPNVLLAYLSFTRITYLLRPRSVSQRRILVVAMGSMRATGRPDVSINSLRPTQRTSRTKTSNTFPLASALPAHKISVAETSTSINDKIED